MLPILSLSGHDLWPGAAQAGFACAGFGFPSGSPTAHNANDLEIPAKTAIQRKISSVLTSSIQTTYLLLDKFLLSDTMRQDWAGVLSA